MAAHILLWSPLDGDLADLIGSLEGVSVQSVSSIAAFAEALPSADAIVMLGHLYSAEVAALMRACGTRPRWIQLTTAGYDGITFHGVPDHVVVTNAGRSHAPTVAEHAVTLLAALVRRLPAWGLSQQRQVFDRAIDVPQATLEDATVTILGYGAIGRETACRLVSFGAHVLGVARTARPDDLATRVYPTTGLHRALAQSDALVIATALTAETKGMVDAAALAAMKPGGVLVNVARGGVLDTGALIAALHSGHLAGAGLDVTDPEPLPPGHALWDCPNLIVTPHVSAIGSAAVRRRIAALIAANVVHFQAGKALAHVVVEAAAPS